MINTKRKTQRAFNGLIGRDEPSKPTVVKSAPVQDESRADKAIKRAIEKPPAPLLIPVKTMTEILEEQQAETETWESIKFDGWQPDDDAPIVRSSRPRGSKAPRFQKYQFRLRVTGDKNSRWDRGLSPEAYGSMASSLQVRQNGLDENGASTEALSKEANKAESDFDVNATVGLPKESVTIANVAQSLPRGFSVGVLSSKFDFTNPPRRPKPETAWIFSEERFKFFVTRQVPDEALAAYSNHDDKFKILRLFARSLKTFIALYYHFKIGLSDKGVFEDPDLVHLRQDFFWPSTNALKRDRARIIQEGIRLFGLPPAGKDVPDYDPQRVSQVWPIFMKVFRSL